MKNGSRGTSSELGAVRTMMPLEAMAPDRTPDKGDGESLKYLHHHHRYKCNTLSVSDVLFSALMLIE